MKTYVLITGASGFIGNALISRILKENKNFHLILLSRNHQNKLHKENSNITWVTGNINDLSLISKILKEYKIKFIYHLAAQSIIKEYFNNPYMSYIDTVMGQVSILEAVRLTGIKSIKKILIITSYKVYGSAVGPFNESTLFDPKSTYETAKACQDLIAQNYAEVYNLPINIIRACNIFGPKDNNLDRLIPKTIDLINQNQQPEVYNSVRYNKREYIYIDDVIDAILLVTHKAEPGEVYCLSGKIYLSIEDIVVNILTYMNKPNLKYKIIKDNLYIKETNEHRIDNSKLRLLGWEPKTTFVTGIKKCIKSYNRQFKKTNEH